MQGPAIELGVQLAVLAEAPDAAAALVIPAAPVGDHTDVETVRAFARDCDVVTFDHEHVPAAVLDALRADGVSLHPSPEALHFAQDKLAMRERLGALGVPGPRWVAARTQADVDAFAARGRLAPRGEDAPRRLRRQGRTRGVGSDRPRRLARAGREPRTAGGGVLLEERVAFTRELAVLVARSPSGQAAAWPVVETVQTDGICTEVLAPAPALDPALAAEATATALRVAGELGVTGVIAVELFEVAPSSAEGRRLPRQRARHAPPQQRPLVDGRGRDRAVRAAPARRARPAARQSHHPVRLDGDGQRARWRARRALQRLPARHGPRPGGQGAPLRQGGAPRPQDRARQRVVAARSADARARATHAADYLAGAIDE